ncbi:hypothetical protein BU15DRAFT_70703 [Melanogaster broomeanus]|nr:hypothetical protein BU15DRAFT_70703 [Melanogaster broomeanus]
MPILRPTNMQKRVAPTSAVWYGAQPPPHSAPKATSRPTSVPSACQGDHRVPDTPGRQPETSRTRERRPTEKENYCLEEIESATRRQQDKVTRNERQALKALRTAFQNNPDGFDKEPEALHSDANSEEDTMFTDRDVTTKLTSSKKKTLMFSARKVPPSTPVQTEVQFGREPTPGNNSTEAASDELEEDEDTAGSTLDDDSSTQAGAKRRRGADGSEQDDAMMPKMQKVNDGMVLGIVTG